MRRDDLRKERRRAISTLLLLAFSGLFAAFVLGPIQPAHALGPSTITTDTTGPIFPCGTLQDSNGNYFTAYAYFNGATYTLNWAYSNNGGSSWTNAAGISGNTGSLGAGSCVMDDLGNAWLQYLGNIYLFNITRSAGAISSIAETSAAMAGFPSSFAGNCFLTQYDRVACTSINAGYAKPSFALFNHASSAIKQYSITGGAAGHNNVGMNVGMVLGVGVEPSSGDLYIVTAYVSGSAHNNQVWMNYTTPSAGWWTGTWTSVQIGSNFAGYGGADTYPGPGLVVDGQSHLWTTYPTTAGGNQQELVQIGPGSSLATFTPIIGGGAVNIGAVSTPLYVNVTVGTGIMFGQWNPATSAFSKHQTLSGTFTSGGYSINQQAVQDGAEGAIPSSPTFGVTYGLGSANPWSLVFVSGTGDPSVTVNLNPSPGSSAINGANYFTVTYTFFGASGQTARLQGASTSFVADSGTTPSIGATSSASSGTERWCISLSAGSCQATTFTIPATTLPVVTFAYYDQVLQASSFTTGGGSLPSGSTANLVGWWKFDDGSGTSATDSTANANTGTLNGAPVGLWLNPSQCVNGGCLNFISGSSQYVNVPNNGAFAFASSTTPFTIRFWVDPFVANDGNVHSLVSKNGACAGCGDTGYGVRLDAGGTVTGYLMNAGNVECSAGTSAAITTYIWHFVMFTDTGTNCYLWLDNVLGNSGAQVVTPISIANTAPLTIGADYANGGGVGLFGSERIDDVAIYSSSFTAAMQTQQYQSYQPTMHYASAPAPVTGNLNAWWSLCEGSASPMFGDYSGNSNTMTPSGAITAPAAPTGNACGLTFSHTGSEYATSSLNLNGASAYTIMGWVNIVDNVGGTWQIVEGDTLTDNGFGVSSAGNLQAAYCIGGSCGNVNLISSVAPGWYWLAETFGSSTVSVYMDGSLFSTVSKVGTVTAGTSFNIGGKSGSDYCDCSVADPREYGAALNPTQIMQMYQWYQTVGFITGQTLSASAVSLWLDKGAAYTTDTPVYGSTGSERWMTNDAPTQGLSEYNPMEEGTGNLVQDVSGNGALLSLVNTPTWLGGLNCKFGSCLGFASASSQYAVIEGPPPIGSAVSATFWFYPTAFPVSASDLMTVAGGEIVMSTTGGSTYLAIQGYGLGITRSTLALSLNVWYFATVTASASTGQAVYVNVANSASTGGSPGFTSGLGNWYLAKGTQGYPDVVIDDARIFPFVISLGEMTELYNLAPLGTATQANGQINPSYSHQYSATLDYAISGGGAPSAPAFTRNYLGASTGSTLTTSPTAYWVDALATCSVTNPLVGSSGTERWQTAAQCNSGNAVTAAFTQAFTYYNQYLQTFSYQILYGGAPDAPGLACTQFGSSFQATLTTAATGYWCDNGQAWSVGPNPLASSTGTERWDTSQTVSGTISGAQTTAFSFTHQYALVVQYAIADSGLSNAPHLAYENFGSPTSLALTTSYQTVWADSGSSWTATSPFTSQPDLKVWYASPRGALVPAGQGVNNPPFTVNYGSTQPACGAATAAGSEENGCYAQAFFQVYMPLIGLNFFMGFLIGAPLIAVWIKSENSWIPLLLFIAAGGIFGGALPNTFGVLGVVFATIGLVGIVYKVFTRPNMQ